MNLEREKVQQHQYIILSFSVMYHYSKTHSRAPCSRQSSIDRRRLRWLVHGLTNKSSVSVCKQKISSVFSRSAIIVPCVSQGEQHLVFCLLFTNKLNLGRSTFVKVIDIPRNSDVNAKTYISGRKSARWVIQSAFLD